jgi:hypothetical protein
VTASPKILEALLGIDAKLAAHGVHAQTPYWRARSEAVYMHHSALVDVEEVGRGGIKTGWALKTAIAEVLAGGFVIPPGERHYHVHVSENLTEANKSSAILQQYLRMLGVRFETRDGAIELLDMPLGFRVLACRIGAVSGFRCIGWTADECAKWDNDGVNPSAEVIASLRAMTVTHPNARGRIISSPLGKIGYFFERRSEGNTETQTYGHAPTWVANPSVTEAHTRTLAPSKLWLREYFAEPQEGASAALEPDHCRACIRPFRQARAIGGPFLGADLSQGKIDSTCWLAGQWYQPVLTEFEVYDYTEIEPGQWVANFPPDGPRIKRKVLPEPPRAELRITRVNSVGAYAKRGITIDSVFDMIASTAETSGAHVVFADDYMGEMAKSFARERGLEWRALPWSSPSIQDQFAVLRQWLRDGDLAIEDTAEGHALVGEMVGLSEVIRPSGALTFNARRGQRDDRAACLRSIAQAQAELILPSPIAKRNSLIVDSPITGRRHW